LTCGNAERDPRRVRGRSRHSLVILPDVDLSLARAIPALLGMALLVYGLVAESQ